MAMGDYVVAGRKQTNNLADVVCRRDLSISRAQAQVHSVNKAYLSGNNSHAELQNVTGTS